MTEYASTEPEKIVAGDLVQWKREAAGLSIPTGEVPKASAGWALTYALVKSGTRIAITAATHETHNFLASIPAATSAGYAAGVYTWQAYVTKSTERYLVDSGTIEIVANYAAASTGYDSRSHVKATLDALEAMLLKRASNDQAQMIVSGQAIGLMSIDKLLAWRDKYKQAYADEQAAERVANGLGSGKQILVRFVND